MHMLHNADHRSFGITLFLLHKCLSSIKVQPLSRLPQLANAANRGLIEPVLQPRVAAARDVDVIVSKLSAQRVPLKPSGASGKQAEAHAGIVMP
ncbi:hypothetical protein [Tropicibacter sp. S64]|uniref:hypothetical protein n=1 Tax=Tropicibacter sp. S64 TaxID=3415122 RepID=UPI003C7ACB23